jgi:hypothetical protein
MAQAWNAALEFLLVGDRARSLAEVHTLQRDGRCAHCLTLDCSAAALASEALAILAAGEPSPRPARAETS